MRKYDCHQGLMEREATMINRAAGRTSRKLGVVLRAAQKAVGTARMTASRVPNVAILMVFHEKVYSVGHSCSPTTPGIHPSGDGLRAFDSHLDSPERDPCEREVMPCIDVPLCQAV